MTANIKKYIIESLRFYALKMETLPPVLFSIILISGFSSVFIPQEVLNNTFINIAYNFLSILLVYGASITYLYACIREIRGEEYNWKSITRFLAGRGLLVAFASLLLFVITLTGFVLLIVPGIILSLMFIFVTSYMTDKKLGIMEAFNASVAATRGRKAELFIILLIFNLILFLPMMILTIFALSTGNDLVFSFVITFAAALTNLMQQKLIALVYIDVEKQINEVQQNKQKI